MVLNQAGEQFLQAIQPPLAALDKAAEALKHWSKWGHPRLRVGGSASICQHLLPGVIRELKRVHERIDLQVQTIEGAQILAKIQNGELDLAIGVALDSAPGLKVRPLFQDELMLVFTPTHPWTNSPSLGPEELRRQPFILPSANARIRGIIDDYFQNLDIVPSTIMEVDNAEAIKELVQLNVGVTILAPWTLERELARKSLALRPLGSRPVTRNWAVHTLSSHRPNLAEETFTKLCRQHAAGMRLDRKDLQPRRK
jgi:DNA-binding transcriptional LysR family regulator